MLSDIGVDFILVFVVGFISQLIDGTLGMGFGVVSASFLLGVGVPPASAIVAVNAAKVFVGVFSAVSHWRAGNVRKDWLRPLLIPGIVGGCGGAYLLSSLSGHGIRPWISLVLVVMGGVILWRCISRDRNVRSTDPRPVAPIRSGEGYSMVYRFRFYVVGLVAGFINAISGAYGPLATSTLMLAKGAVPAQAVGTVSFAELFVAITAVSTFRYEMTADAFPWVLSVGLSLGGAMAAPIAAAFCRRLPHRILAYGIGFTLVVINIRGLFL